MSSSPNITHHLAPQQRQTQHLALAPQIQQSLKILQAAALDLRAVIQQELQTNPTLEELPPQETISLEQAAETAANTAPPAGASDTAIDRPDTDDAPDDDTAPDTAVLSSGSDGVHAVSAPAPDDADDTAPLDFTPNGKEYDILQKLDQDWRDHMTNAGGAQPYTADAAEKRQHFLDSLATETSLQEHLLSQADLADLPEKTAEALRYLIGSLDDRGYLTQPPADIALQTTLPFENVQEALALLQTFDPIGIGAQTIAESLLIQLDSKHRSKFGFSIFDDKPVASLETRFSIEDGAAAPANNSARQRPIQNPESKIQNLAARIIRDHFDLLARRRIPELARKLNATPEDIQSAIAEISTLTPAPARRFADDTNHAIIPDVTITKDPAAATGWKITLNSDYIPRLRISNTYRELIAKGTLTKTERDYLAEQMRSGKFLIDSIERRQQTIERITREILNRQREFFETGVSKLKPLTMSQIAEALGVHETTISRAIANKYIQTPRGVFELKYFFTTGYETATGETISNTSVKELLAALIAAEDRARPLSDEDLSIALQEKGLTISRRTVAKYREELNIPASSLRRDYTKQL